VRLIVVCLTRQAGFDHARRHVICELFNVARVSVHSTRQETSAMSSTSSVSRRVILTNTVAALPVTTTITIPNVAANHPDATLFEMVSRVQTLMQERAELEYTTDDTYDDEAYQGAWQQCVDLEDQLALTPAHTIDGIRCKAHALVALAWDGMLDDGTDLNLGEGLLRSIIRDLLALPDAAAAMSAGYPQHSPAHANRPRPGGRRAAP
jgi:hypothetical protein